jgi:hypothetical protein
MVLDDVELQPLAYQTPASPQMSMAVPRNPYNRSSLDLTGLLEGSP